MKNILLSQALLWKESRYKGSITINSTMALFLGFAVLVAVLGIMLPALMNLKGMDACTGPFKALASVLADMTGNDMC